MSDERLDGRIVSARADLRESLDSEPPRFDVVARRSAARHRTLAGTGVLLVAAVTAIAFVSQVDDSGSNVVASVDESEASGESVDDTPASGTVGDGLTIDEIDARQSAWEESGPEAYRYVIDSTCGCDWGGSFEVTVVAGEVVSTVPTDPSNAEPYRKYFSQSVDEMFAMFREALTVGAEEDTDASVTADFDGDFGHPVVFAVHWTRRGEGYNATISSFAPIEASEASAPDTSTVPLVISNQSYDHPDALIEVRIDGELVVDNTFPVEGQHTFTTYDVPLEPGSHELLATSDAGARLSQVIEVVAGEPLFLALLHWTAEEPGQEPAYFNFSESDQPLGFG